MHDAIIVSTSHTARPRNDHQQRTLHAVKTNFLQNKFNFINKKEKSKFYKKINFIHKNEKSNFYKKFNASLSPIM